ncbi:uncharacterized protein LOC134800636 [Cydia splendana]|uniref:uncharacterized protein LOC134800636 n=1 Tax=Cydia splendana TaxID=1100963 RepID=UPI00300C2636
MGSLTIALSVVAVLLAIGYSEASGSCPVPSKVHSCSPKCKENYECSNGKLCCRNGCNEKSCAEPVGGSQGAGGNKYGGMCNYECCNGKLCCRNGCNEKSCAEPVGGSQGAGGNKYGAVGEVASTMPFSFTVPERASSKAPLGREAVGDGPLRPRLATLLAGGNKYGAGTNSGIYCNNQKCSPQEVCKMDPNTKRMRCVRS